MTATTAARGTRGRMDASDSKLKVDERSLGIGADGEQAEQEGRDDGAAGGEIPAQRRDVAARTPLRIIDEQEENGDRPRQCQQLIEGGDRLARRAEKAR